MKKIACLLLMVVVGVLVSSWTTLNSSKANQHHLIFKKELKGSDSWNIHKIEDISGVWLNQCTGEEMQVSATWEFLNTGTVNNNKLTSVWNVRVYGTAVGLESGTQYIIRENNNSTFNGSFVNGLIAFPLHDKWHLISQGNGANVLGEFSWNLVYNAKGEEVVNTFDFQINCN